MKKMSSKMNKTPEAITVVNSQTVCDPKGHGPLTVNPLDPTPADGSVDVATVQGSSDSTEDSDV